MELNGFEMFALLLCSCLFGIILSVFNMSDLVTDREMALTTTLFVASIAFFYFQHFTKNALVGYLEQHKTEIEKKQVADLQEAHRRRVLGLKQQHTIEIHQLQGSLTAANANFERVNGEYDWISNMYQDQIHTAREQEDRIMYLEGKLQESGQLTPSTRQPYSAPPSQIQFASPPRRSRFGSAMKSPLAQVMDASETE